MYHTRYQKSILASFVLMALLVFSACEKDADTVWGHFESVDQTHSGINFQNTLPDTGRLNILSYLYFYNGAGVATADFDGDGAVDVYLVSNQGPDQIYRNTGNFRFENKSSGLPKRSDKEWHIGVSVVDINADGLPDLYLSVLGGYEGKKGSNKLLINRGNFIFEDQARAYGLDFSGFATQALFLDYDLDGDLDCFLLTHSVKDPSQFRPAKETRLKNFGGTGDRLYRNDDGIFIEVTKSAGIMSSYVGFGLGVASADFNADGWPDIFVGNDFHENDYLYINQGNGTFREESKDFMTHMSNFSMGVDVADVNGDGLPDIFSLDMKPDEEEIYKASGGWEDISLYRFKRSYGYGHQLSRNALHLNQRFSDSLHGFVEVASFYGLEATDWSWSVLMNDMDLDGRTDIMIANGIVRRPNDLDFVNFFNQPASSRDVKKLLAAMPSGSADNVYFRQVAPGNFERIHLPQVSRFGTGMATADFDGDGDLDVIINNINEPATVLRNITPARGAVLRLQDTLSKNRDALGAQIWDDQGTNLKAIQSCRGFLSSSEPVANFALGDLSSRWVMVKWPDGHQQKIAIKPGSQTYCRSAAASDITPPGAKRSMDPHLIPFGYQAPYQNDQDALVLLPYGLSSHGPKWMERSLNDTLWLQQVKYLTQSCGIDLADLGDLIIFDRQGDAEYKIYFAMANQKWPSGHARLRDRVFQYSPAGFREVAWASESPRFQSSQVLAVDPKNTSREGLLLAVHPSVRSLNTEAGLYHLHFTEQGKISYEKISVDGWIMDMDYFPEGKKILIAGHWMPIHVLEYTNNSWQIQKIDNSAGLWNRLEVADLNQDGILDIIAGNMGLNHPLADREVRLHFGDYDGSGYLSPLLCYTREGVEYPFANLEMMVSQMPKLKKQFLFNRDYAPKNINQIFPQLKQQTVWTGQIALFSSGVFFGQKDGNYIFQAFPEELQWGAIHSIVPSSSKSPNSWFFGGGNGDVDPNWGRMDGLMPSIWKYEKGEWRQQKKYQPAFEFRQSILAGNHAIHLVQKRDSFYLWKSAFQ